MSNTYLTTEELSGKIKYDARTIRTRLKDSVLLEGIHYIRTFSSSVVTAFTTGDAPCSRVVLVPGAERRIGQYARVKSTLDVCGDLSSVD